MSNTRSTLKVTLAFFVATAVTTISYTAANACPFNKGSYRLVEDKSYTLTMLPPDANSAVELARAEISQSGTVFLKGYITASQGFSTVYFVPKIADMKDESDISLLFLNGKLRASSEDTVYVVTQKLSSTLYYWAREIWAKHPIAGEVWQRATCN